MFGVLWALLVEYGNFHEYFFEFTPELFFHFLLPPIILEAAYSLYNKAFFDNLNTILLYAVVVSYPIWRFITSDPTLQGTLFNFSVIGGLLIAIDTLGFMGELPAIPIEDHNVRKMHTSCFPKDLCAGKHNSVQHKHDPDPGGNLHLLQHHLCCGPRGGAGHVRDKHGWSVLWRDHLCSFSEVGVNSDLYYMVFGESLLNDGVAVVLYVMMNSFAGDQNSQMSYNAISLARTRHDPGRGGDCGNGHCAGRLFLLHHRHRRPHRWLPFWPHHSSHHKVLQGK